MCIVVFLVEAWPTLTWPCILHSKQKNKVPTVYSPNFAVTPHARFCHIIGTASAQYAATANRK